MPRLPALPRFSALQRAEIAEIAPRLAHSMLDTKRFSALQRAEIAEIGGGAWVTDGSRRFSALQRAEIAEISCKQPWHAQENEVSVLFNEPKLPKSSSNYLWS